MRCWVRKKRKHFHNIKSYNQYNLHVMCHITITLFLFNQLSSFNINVMNEKKKLFSSISMKKTVLSNNSLSAMKKNKR